MATRLRLADLLGGFSIVADLGYGLPPEEAMRCCLVGTALARLCGLTQGEVADTFFTALLRHVGSSGSLTRCPPCWETILERTEREQGRSRGSPSGLRGDEIAPAARVARAAGDAVLFHRLGGQDLAKDALRRRAGSILDPAVVDAFASNAESLMEEATDGDPREGMLQAEPHPVAEVDGTNLPDVAAAFGDIADLKVPFTHGHSAEVARLAQQAARRLGLDGTSVKQLHLAGLVHDLGRAGVSNAVWEKPGRLTSVEWE